LELIWGNPKNRIGKELIWAGWKEFPGLFSKTFLRPFLDQLGELGTQNSGIFPFWGTIGQLIGKQVFKAKFFINPWMALYLAGRVITEVNKGLKGLTEVSGNSGG